MRIKYYLLGGIFSVLMACHPNMNLVDVKIQENIVIGQEIEDKKEFVNEPKNFSYYGRIK